MARFSERDRRWVDVVVDRWRESCLIEDGSLLSGGDSLWTSENIKELYEAFNEGQLEGEQSFEQKLTTQLGGTEDNTKRLMAEVVVVYFLFASSVGGPRKRELVSFILAMSGDEFPVDEELLKAFSAGIGGPGQAFNSYRPFLLAYVISFARRFKGIESNEERRTLLADAWNFRAWLVGPSDDADSGEQMMRHLLLHLLFPDEMERIASGPHKWRIAERTASRRTHGFSTSPISTRRPSKQSNRSSRSRICCG
jgi:5-methylcytosine-specific restriction enzyme B